MTTTLDADTIIITVLEEAAKRSDLTGDQCLETVEFFEKTYAYAQNPVGCVEAVTRLACRWMVLPLAAAYSGRLLNAAIACNPDNQELQFHLCSSLTFQQRFDEAIALATQCVNQSNSPVEEAYSYHLMLTAYGQRGMMGECGEQAYCQMIYTLERCFDLDVTELEAQRIYCCMFWPPFFETSGEEIKQLSMAAARKLRESCTK